MRRRTGGAEQRWCVVVLCTLVLLLWGRSIDACDRDKLLAPIDLKPLIDGLRDQYERAFVMPAVVRVAILSPDGSAKESILTIRTHNAETYLLTKYDIKVSEDTVRKKGIRNAAESTVVLPKVLGDKIIRYLEKALRDELRRHGDCDVILHGVQMRIWFIASDAFITADLFSGIGGKGRGPVADRIAYLLYVAAEAFASRPYDNRALTRALETVASEH